MSTSSTIALEYADGHVETIYCHNDGLIRINGRILFKSYSDAEKVKELMKLGNMSILNESIEKSVFYRRDKKESMNYAESFESFDDYLKNHEYQDYEYILRNSGEWFVCKTNQNRQYVKLETVI